MRVRIKRVTFVTALCVAVLLVVFYRSVTVAVSRNQLLSPEHYYAQCSLKTAINNSAFISYVSFIRKFVAAPEEFNKNYRNPCWYAKLMIPEYALKIFHKTPVVRNPLFSEKAAFSLVNSISQSYSIQNSSKYGTKHQRLVCLPSIYLAGFPKCGTTSLYNVIVHHPSIVPPNTKESHFWSTFLRDGNVLASHRQIHVLWYLSQYYEPSDLIRMHPYMYTLDGSVDTLWASENPQLTGDSESCFHPLVMFHTIPSAKFVVIMRDPVSRLFSDFWYFCSIHNWKQSNGTIQVPESIRRNAAMIFHNLTLMAIESFKRCIRNGYSHFECTKRSTVGDASNSYTCPPLRLGIGLYYYHIVKWLNVFPFKQFLFLQTEELLLQPFSVLERLWNFLEVENVPKTQFYEALKQRSNEMHWIKSKKYSKDFVMLPETNTLLKEFYHPYNKKLVSLLGNSQFLWDV